VTEAVYGIDLVALQLRLARGEALAAELDPARLVASGHAVECRLYAEHPARGFLPSPGTLRALALPDGDGVRVDTGYRAGDAVTPYYDPLIAKLIVHGPDRDTALARLRTALAACRIEGLRSNLEFLRRLAADPDFAAGRLSTRFVEEHPALLA